MVEMELREIQMSNVDPHQIIVLEEKDGSRTFPIFIGLFEADAADQAVRKRVAPRPMTHDLIMNVIEGLDAQIEAVVIDSLANDTFHGKLILRNSKDKAIKIDARPSDAIVLASKAEVPIYVAEEVLDQVVRSDDDE